MLDSIRKTAFGRARLSVDNADMLKYRNSKLKRNELITKLLGIKIENRNDLINDNTVQEYIDSSFN